MQKNVIVLLLLFVAMQANGQIFKPKKQQPIPVTVVVQDTIKKEKPDPYKKVITSEAVTDSGFFITHKVGDLYYFELPKTVINKEILITSRISGFVKNLNFGGAGVESRPQRVIRWQKRENQILMRYVSYNSIADENEPIYASVKNNNFEPIIMSFDIKTYNKDSSAYVIDVAPLFTQDVDLIGPVSNDDSKKFGLRGVDGKRSFIQSMKSFPENVEVKHVLTFNGTNLPDNQLAGAMSIEMNQSFVLLPEIPMVPREYDQRVGYFSVAQTNYSLDEQKAAQQRFITKWRLEPKDGEWAKYLKGELVEPKKQIVYYLDPATPEKWRPFIKQGIEDWQVAFEAAGFKNAIVAKDPPTKEEDPDWSPEDVRYSVVRYVTTDIQNAMGPHVHDPRTGEIIESDIIWYHNVMNLLRNWYFIQTAAINPNARSVKFKDEVMGRLIRFVSSHEVGHTLGLPHNMGSSSAYPVDSLRSPRFTNEMGTAPSIMDYARFNYIAQPGDGDVSLMPGIGPYDKWSIKYGYQLMDSIVNKTNEKEVLNSWVKERASNKLYRFGRQRGLVVDPSAQSEDLGDDAMYASELGIKNLSIVIENLEAWTKQDGKDYTQLTELYEQVFVQLRRYIGHVVANVGGIYENYKSTDQDGPVYEFVDKQKQRMAITFLIDQIFETPYWLENKSILSKTEEFAFAEKLRLMQDQTLAQLINQDRLKRLIENSALNGENAYSVYEMFDDLSKAIYKEFDAKTPISLYRRNLQRTFLEGMQRVLESESNQYEHTDMKAAARLQLTKLKTKFLISRYPDEVTKSHVWDMIERINKILEYKEK
ncbi:MAG: zinc-dependent metalloprotease [Saprospiraceae bacterium]|nr:zinc-dependent metalloprotease [Saprospiraceae bacterium]